MTKILYLAREIINKKTNSTTKFETDATIVRINQTLTIKYQENLADKANCSIYYNGDDTIIINRITDNDVSNTLTIQKNKFVSNNYLTLYGQLELSTIGKEITISHLKDGTNVLKFIYDIYQNGELLNTHKIYLQIKE